MRRKKTRQDKTRQEDESLRSRFGLEMLDQRVDRDLQGILLHGTWTRGGSLEAIRLIGLLISRGISGERIG